MTPEASFLKSCSAPGDLPEGDVPEVALLGRSNVGKSSLLNALAGRHELAKTSRTPGRTRLLNLFGVEGLRRKRTAGPDLYLVDCPGYGYAKVAREMRVDWSELIQPYLEHRPQLCLCVLLVDAMLPPQAMDLDLHAWLRARERPVLLVATKWDRLSGNQRPQSKRALQEAFQDTPLGFSSVTKEGREALWARIGEQALEPAGR